MQVILLERIEKLGIIGDVVEVKPGFARNFLLPQGKALRANAANKAAFEERRAQIEADNIQRRDEASSVAERMEGLTISLIRSASDAGMLYGSVSTRDIATGVSDQGFSVDRTQILLDRPIKNIGIHEVRVRLHPEVDTTVNVNVAKSEDEAAQQLLASEEAAEEAIDPLLLDPLSEPFDAGNSDDDNQEDEAA